MVIKKNKTAKVIAATVGICTLLSIPSMAAINSLNPGARLIMRAPDTTNATAEYGFVAQPVSRDFGRITNSGTFSLDTTGSGIAWVGTQDTGITLEYYNEETDSWLDSGLALTLTTSGGKQIVNAPAVDKDSPILNTMLRLVLPIKAGVRDEIEYSDIFYMMANTYTEHTLPSPLSGMSESQIYGYTAGTEMVLVPQMEVGKDIDEIQWEVSEDGGNTWEIEKTVYPTKSSEYVYMPLADCDNSGKLYRSIVNPSETGATYSDPFEVIVYEQYQIDNGELTIQSAGPSGIMNDYQSGRLAGKCPWLNEKGSIKKITFGENISEIKAETFKDYTALESINLGNMEVIGNNAFENCTKLKAATLPATLTELKKDAFKGCASLLEVRILNPDTKIDSSTDTIPLTEKEIIPDDLKATSAKNNLVVNEHSYPVIYGYKGIAQDDANKINKTSPGSTAYNYAVSTGKAFYPIGAIDHSGYERPLEWDYMISGENITKISLKGSCQKFLKDASGVEVHIPKSVDGYKVITLDGVNVVGTTPVCGIEEHTHTAECETNGCDKEEHTHTTDCYDNELSKDLFGVSMEVMGETSGYTFSAIYIPDTVESIAEGAFASAGSIEKIYNFSTDPQDVSEGLSGSDGQQLFTYSSNYTMRKTTSGYSHILFDLDRFDGTTGNVEWRVDLNDRVLYISGKGSTADYAQASDQPYYKLRNDIENIVVSDGVTGIGNYACSGISFLKGITFASNSITRVSNTAFLDSSMSWTYGGKNITCYINNQIYDAIMTLNNQIETEWIATGTSTIQKELNEKNAEYEKLVQQRENMIAAGSYSEEEIKAIDSRLEKLQAEITKLEDKLDDATDVEKQKFNISFRDTKASCGTGIEFAYSSADLTLRITGDGEMTQFVDPNDVPWRPVNQYIRKVIINAEVVSLSNYAFHNLTNLRNVFNYGKNQVIRGGNDSVFDVISRNLSTAELEGESSTLTIPDIDLTTASSDEIDAWYEGIETQARALSLDLTVADMRGWTLTCGKSAHTHTDICYTDGELSCIQEEHTHTVACYDMSGNPHSILPGEYTILKTATTDEILDILSGKTQDAVTGKYIVPVYTFGDDNKSFSDSVPSKDNGYELMAIYNQKGQCGDDLTFYVSLDNTLLIEGTGDMWDFEEGQSPWAESSKNIREVAFPDKLTKIGSFAFENCELITGFDIPERVTQIGIGAFKNCYNLYQCVIGPNVTDLGSGLFAGCSSLRIVDDSQNNLFEVADGYLYDLDNEILLGFLRETLYEDQQLKTLYKNEPDYTVPDYIKVIGAMAYYEADSFHTLLIPETVTDIQDRAFYGIQGLENIDLASKEKVNVAGTAFNDCGGLFDETDPKKYAIMYSVNNTFAIIAQRVGYPVVYHDSKEITKISASYTGPTVMVGRSFDRNDVNLYLMYANGESETVYGTDSRINFKDMIVKNIGENKFTATFDDGYGQVLETNEFTVEGTNTVASVTFTYTGPTVWCGEEIDRNYILAKLTYADGSTKTVNGRATYSTPSGNKNCITLSQTMFQTEGENVINATYQDGVNGAFSGKITLNCQKYIKRLAAEYSGHSVEMSSGYNDLEMDKVKIDIAWSDGSVESITGEDARVEFSNKTTTAGNNLIFEFTINDRNRYGHMGSFSAGYTTNLDSVNFAYVGAAVTNGMTFSLSDVQLTLNYSTGKSQKVSGDTVSGLTADNMVIHTSDGLEEIHLTYVVGTAEYKGTIYVPGKIRTPVKLIVVKRPTKSVYQDGDAFDPAGMVVNCLFSNGDSQDVTDSIQYDANGILSSTSKFITLVYEDASSGQTISTNMAVNVNQYQKELTLSKTFKEQYEITKVLFRSKKTEDTAGETGENPDDPDAEENGKWQDVTPLLNYSSYDEDHDATDVAGNSQYNPPIIKAGYGFELKVFTKYRTNRAGSEFNAFLKKALWDSEFETANPTISHDDFNTYWKYLNDVYPQVTAISNPDMLYFRTVNGHVVDENGQPIKNLIGEDGQPTDFIVMEKTNKSETEETIDEGEWFNSTKVFEFPLRTIVGDEETRRVYVSTDAANPNEQYTDYTIQIISPAWYGYEPEPYYEGNKFHYSTDTGETYGAKSYAYNDPQTKYLHVCVGLTLRVKANDDMHTHILE